MHFSFQGSLNDVAREACAGDKHTATSTALQPPRYSVRSAYRVQSEQRQLEAKKALSKRGVGLSARVVQRMHNPDLGHLRPQTFRGTERLRTVADFPKCPGGRTVTFSGVGLNLDASRGWISGRRKNRLHCVRDTVDVRLTTSFFSFFFQVASFVVQMCCGTSFA